MGCDAVTTVENVNYSFAVSPIQPAKFYVNITHTGHNSMANYNGELAKELGGLLGDGLRSVASYDRGGYMLHHIRDDLDADYSREEIRKVYKQIEIEGMGYGHFEDLFQTGRLECAMYGFEKALMFHFATGAFTGLFVAVDRERGLDIDTIIDICQEAIRRNAEE